MTFFPKRQELLRIVLDTSVLVAAFRSPYGASRRMLELLLAKRFILLATPALFLEYESVLCRAEHIAVHGYSTQEIERFLELLSGFTELVRVDFQWRPQLRDPGDEFVPEAAINGKADAIVTFNGKHFLPATLRFGIEVVAPGSIIKERFVL